MKKLILMVFAIILLSCGGSKVVNTAEKTMKGNWSLSSITYNKIGTYNVKLLDDVSKECFEASTWEFIPNNHTGTYSIINADCATGDRYFNFTVQEINYEAGHYDFLLKPTNEKGKSDTNQGFRMKITLLTETEMQWEQTVTVDGAPFIINMNFTKL